MGWFAKIAWSLGMWICGAFVMSVFGSQIRIVNACTKKILSHLSKLENSSNCFHIDACKKYLNGVIIKNILIITAISGVVYFLVPTIGITFYFIGMFITWLLSIGAMGLTEANIEESIIIFHRYVIPSQEESAIDLLALSIDQTLIDPSL